MVFTNLVGVSISHCQRPFKNGPIHHPYDFDLARTNHETLEEPRVLVWGFGIVNFVIDEQDTEHCGQVKSQTVYTLESWASINGWKFPCPILRA